MNNFKKNDTRLVYSSDGSHLKICKKCREEPCQCVDQVENLVPVVLKKLKCKMRIEKAARGGKIVTVIFDLPYNPPYFESLLKKIKSQLGTGGSLKKNHPHLTIEIQGDHRDKIQKIWEKLQATAVDG